MRGCRLGGRAGTLDLLVVLDISRFFRSLLKDAQRSILPLFLLELVVLLHQKQINENKIP